MKKIDYLKELDGCEIWSIRFEDCVLVTDGKIYRNGKIITATKKQIEELYQEHFEAEFGTRDISKLLAEEFCTAVV